MFQTLDVRDRVQGERERVSVIRSERQSKGEREF